MAHSFYKTIRGFHCDAYGHVNNARYAEFLEEARWQCIDDNDVDEKLEQLHLQFFLVRLKIDFKRGLTPGQQIEVRTETMEIQGKSIVFLQQILDVNTGKLCTEALVTFVLFHGLEKKTIEPSEEVQKLFKSI
jgi:thioesterase-3